jgi:hypothetical protein
LVAFTFAAVTSGALLLSRCASGTFSVPEATVERTDAGEVQTISHRGTEEGVKLPEWLETYRRGGIAAVENMPDYTESYAFMVEKSDVNQTPVMDWLARDTPSTALSEQAASRVRERLRVVQDAAPGKNGFNEDAASAFIGAVRGNFFGTAREVNRWWVRARVTPTGSRRATEEYRGYIFCIIDQETLDQELDRLMTAAKFTLTQEERDIWNRTRF